MLAVYLFRATPGAHHQEGLVMTLTASSSSRAVTNSPVVVALDYHNCDDALSFVDNVVAEGVETKEQFEMLRKIHCRVIQGYFFSRPLPAEEIPGWMSSVLPLKI